MNTNTVVPPSKRLSAFAALQMKKAETAESSVSGTTTKNAERATKELNGYDRSRAHDVGVNPPRKKAKRQSMPNNVTSTESVDVAERLKTKKGTAKGRVYADTETVSSTEHPPALLADSAETANSTFAWLIHPYDPTTFFDQVWETRPLVVRRENTYYRDLFSLDDFEKILRTNDIQYSVNLDITRYTDGERETLNPSGRAHASVVWDFLKDGCSARLLNPQTYSTSVWRLCANLQERFATFVGANVYLTPAGTQGFAPHWDDIEAFVLQLEGRKHWRVYAPRSIDETLPRFSSPNFSDADLPTGPVVDVVLEPGDLLYMPRGFIHQACAQADDTLHSLHITVSTTQMNTWGDFLEKLLPQALQLAIAEDVDFRRSLPLDYANYAGIAFSDCADAQKRAAFTATAKRLFTRVWEHALVDAAADQMAKKFVHDSLPPVLTDEEKAQTILGVTGGSASVTSTSRVKLVRRSSLRLVMEGDTQVFVYHNVENGRVYHEKEPQSFEIGPELAPGVEFLLEKYPKFVRVKSLPLESAAAKLTLVRLLFEKCLLLVAPVSTVDVTPRKS